MIDIVSILDGVVSHALASGYFETVNQHEPKSAPGNGLRAAVWSDYIGPVRSSGLSSTSALVVFVVRLYSNMLQEPQDDIDPNLIIATSALIEAYSGDFELGGSVRCVDLLGQTGEGLTARAGYLSMGGAGGSAVMYRIMDIRLPLIVNDAWSQGA